MLLAAVIAGFARFSAPSVAGTRGDAGQRSLGALTDPNGFRPDLAEKLEMTVNSVTASATLFPSFDGDSQLSERILTVSVSLPFQRKYGLIGADLNHPVILNATDVSGSSVALLPTEVDWHRYEGRGYTSYSSRPFGARIPPGVLVELRLDPHQNVPSSLSSVKWYVQALYTENVIRVDVPFEASEEWIEAETMPDLEVRIDRAESFSLVDSRGVQSYLHRYTTMVRSRSRSVLRGQNEELHVGDALPEYLVLGTCFLTDLGTLTPTSLNHSVAGDPGGQGAYCSGRSHYSKGVNGIRHTIAVHPLEVKLPFEFTDIPVPSFQSTSGTDRGN